MPYRQAKCEPDEQGFDHFKTYISLSISMIGKTYFAQDFLRDIIKGGNILMKSVAYEML